MKTLNWTVLVSILFFSNIAFAEPKEFKDADVNGDGFLDTAEFSNSGAKDPFKEFDGNDDGKISKVEYEDKLAECE